MSFLSQFQVSIILGLVVTNDKMTNKFWHSLHNLHSWPSILPFTSLVRNAVKKKKEKKENLKYDCQSNPFHYVCHAAEALLESRSTKCHNSSPCDSWHQMTSKPLSSNSTRNGGGSVWVSVAWIDLVGGRSPRLRLPAHTTMLTDGIFLARVQRPWSPSELSLTPCYVDIPDIQGHRPHLWIILLEAASMCIF